MQWIIQVLKTLRNLLIRWVILNWLNNVGWPKRVPSLALPMIVTIRSLRDRFTFPWRRVYLINSQCRLTWFMVSIPPYGKSLPNRGHNRLQRTLMPAHPELRYVAKHGMCWNSTQNRAKFSSKWLSLGHNINTCKALQTQSLSSFGIRVSKFSLHAFITWKWQRSTLPPVWVFTPPHDSNIRHYCSQHCELESMMSYVCQLQWRRV